MKPFHLVCEWCRQGVWGEWAFSLLPLVVFG